MSAAKRVNVVVVGGPRGGNVVSVPNYMDARRRAYESTKPDQPTATQVNSARGQLFEHALADGLQRVFEIGETLDRFELEIQSRMDKLAALLERYRGQVRRKR